MKKILFLALLSIGFLTSVSADTLTYNVSCVANSDGSLVSKDASIVEGKTYQIVTKTFTNTSQYANFACVGKMNSLTCSSNKTDTNDATATAGQILSGATAYVKGSKITGTMIDRGEAQYGQNLVIAGDYVAINQLPEGYYHSNANSTSWAPEARFSKYALGTTSTNYVLSGQTFSSSNGINLTGTMTNKGSVNTTISPGTTYSNGAGYYSSINVTASSGTLYSAFDRSTYAVTPTVDVGSSKKATKIIAGAYHSNSSTTFKIQGSNNNSTWYDLASFDVCEFCSITKEYTPTSAYRYYRVYLLDDAEKSASIAVLA